MLGITESEWANYQMLAAVVFDRRAPDDERLSKIEQIITMRERFGMPLDITLFWVGSDGTHTRVNTRPYHEEARRIRERIQIRQALAP